MVGTNSWYVFLTAKCTDLIPKWRFIDKKEKEKEQDGRPTDTRHVASEGEIFKCYATCSAGDYSLRFGPKKDWKRASQFANLLACQLTLRTKN